MNKWVTIRRAAELTGHTEKAVRRKIEIGVWPEGVWKRVGGRVYINLDSFDLWVEGRESEVLERASRWTSATRGSAVGSG
jgi:hypothetical protein